MAIPRITKKTKLTLEKTEMKMKYLDKKIGKLKHELYDTVSLETLRKQNVKLSGFMEKKDAVHKDLYFYPDIFSYFRSLEDMMSQNTPFAKIIDALKNEIYLKPDVTLKEDALLRSITLPEKALYCHWILETLMKQLTNTEKCDFDSSLETLSYLQKIMACCNMPVADVFPATLSILNNISFQILSDNEQDLLIFLHATARMQSIFELMKDVDFKHDDSSQLLVSKAKQYEIQKRYLKLLYQLKHFMDSMENIDISKVFDAITKSKGIHIRMEEISEAFETFKRYINAFGQTNGISENFQFEESQKDVNSGNDVCQELSFKVQQCISQSSEKFSKNFGLIFLYEEFEEDAKNLICDLKTFIHEMINMSINDINDVRKHLNCLKSQINFVLQSKWNLQEHLLPIICGDADGCDLNIETNALIKIGQSQLLFERIKDAIFYLKVLEEIEFNKNFSVMSSLCELRKKKDLLIQKFRNFIIRIGHQSIKHAPTIKRDLIEINKEIQILFSDYQKLRSKLQFLSAQEEKNVKNLFEDIEAVIITDIKKYKEKKCVGLMTMRKLNTIESEFVLKKTKDNLEEVKRNVDETMDFLRSLDETIISKHCCWCITPEEENHLAVFKRDLEEFSSMRYLCELHCIKEQILASFENLLDSMFELGIEDKNNIITRLAQLNNAANGLIRKYETIGMQLILFSDVMVIMNKERLELNQIQMNSNVETEMNISELFGPMENLKKLHYNLDAATRDKWFPAKVNLPDMLKDKERSIQGFQNFLERMPELDIHNTLDIILSIRQLIMNAENVLRKYQSLRMQLIWIAGDYVFNIKNI